jgi:hypothetical protein
MATDYSACASQYAAASKSLLKILYLENGFIDRFSDGFFKIDKVVSPIISTDL